MSGIQIIALVLLAFRVLSVAFLIGVLRQQVRLLKTTQTELTGVRKVLICIVLICFSSNVVPVMIDLATIFQWEYSGSLLIPYAFSNAISIFLMSYGWWILYRMIEREQVVITREHDKLVEDNVSLTASNKKLREDK